MKRTYQPSKRKRTNKHGFRKRQARAGRALWASDAGTAVRSLTASDEKVGQKYFRPLSNLKRVCQCGGPLFDNTGGGTSSERGRS
ncbi:MAG: 50S ribosomal protein L34 [Flavobacteriales bacterium]|nr:50S ribosomal protein L34 [Flavobacteriales bacterium]